MYFKYQISLKSQLKLTNSFNNNKLNKNEMNDASVDTSSLGAAYHYCGNKHGRRSFRAEGEGAQKSPAAMLMASASTTVLNR